MRIFKTLVVASLVAVSSSAFAAKSVDKKSNDYYASYYDDEGSLLFKIRGFYAHTDSKMTNLPTPNAGASKPSRLAQSGYGFDTAMTIFVTDNIAAEVSLGLGFYKTRSSALASVANAYGTSDGTTGKRNQIFMVPVAFTAQYHIAPFGGIRPYVGGGLHGTYMYTRSKAMKVNSGFGPVLQAGVDFLAKDDTLFTLDVKQYLLKSKATFKRGFLGTTQDVKSKIAWNPLVISFGIGFKF